MAHSTNRYYPSVPYLQVPHPFYSTLGQCCDYPLEDLYWQQYYKVSDTVKNYKESIVGIVMSEDVVHHS